jgi:hypothetical protein
MTKYQKVQAAGAVFLALFVLGHLTNLPALLGALAVGCFGYAALQFLHDKGWFQDRPPPPTPQPPEARANFGQRSADAIGPTIRIEGPTPQQYWPPPGADPIFRSTGGLAKWKPPSDTYESRMADAIEHAMSEMRDAVKFVRLDPLFYQQIGHLWFVLNSAISRHGVLIEKAIFEALAHEERYQAWHNVMWTKTDGHKLQIDLIVLDKKTGMIRAYEVKRGWSSNGDNAHSQQQSRVNLPAVKAQLQAWAQRQGVPVRGVDTHFISYYAGKLSAQGDMGATLNQHNLNEHFAMDMREHVDHMTTQFKDAIEEYVHEMGLWEGGHGALDEPPTPAPEMVH